MKTYENLQEARKDLKQATGSSAVCYVVDGAEVSAAEYRCAEGKETIYRAGMEIVAEKVTKECL